MVEYPIRRELAAFTRSGVEKFDGMLNKSAAVVAAAAMTIIERSTGWDNRAFLEIGVYKAKFFSLVEFATRNSDCKLIGIDPFGLPDQSKDSVLSALVDNGAELDRINLIEGFSTDRGAMKAAIGERKLSLCHIDGSHKEADVYADFHTVNELAAQDAIIIGDDFWHKSQLGVTTAIFSV